LGSCQTVDDAMIGEAAAWCVRIAGTRARRLKRLRLEASDVTVG
jgi:hypothetical protein